MEIDSRLSLRRKLGYSVGHVMCDAMSALVFSYVIVYVRLAVDLQPKYGGYIIFTTQLCDTIFSPLLGLANDKKSKYCSVSGKHMIWYLTGVVVTTITLSLMFNVMFGDANDSQFVKLLHYLPCAASLSFAFTLMHTTLMVMLTEMSTRETDRIQLNSWKNAVTLVTNLLVYCGAWLLFELHTGDTETSTMTRDDVVVFHILSRVSLAVGFVTSMIFCVFVHKNPIPCERKKWKSLFRKGDEYVFDDVRGMSNAVTTKRYIHKTEDKEANTHVFTISDMPKSTPPCNNRNFQRKDEIILSDVSNSCSPDEISFSAKKNNDMNSITSQTNLTLKTVIKNGKYHQMNIIYASVRLAVIISQVYIPLYVIETLHMDKVAIGIMPLVVYVSGFVTSLLMKRMHKKLGLKKVFLVGDALTIGSCVWVYFIQPSNYQQVYGASILLGAGQATLDVTAVAMITEFIGNKTDHSGAVFGIIGFTEKFFQCATILTLQLLNPCGDDAEAGVCGDFNKNVMIFIPTATTTLSLVAMGFYQFRNCLLKLKTTEGLATKDNATKDSPNTINGNIR